MEINPFKESLVPEENIQRKLTAIMFTDIVGYSKMMGEDEAGSLAFLRFHNSLLQGEIERNGGRVIKTVGDAFLADFGSAVNAVRCAVSIQKQLHEYNLDFTRSSGKNRQVRIGIHIGDVVMRDNDIFGDGVNIAARLQPIAEPGGICISQDVYNHIKNQVEFHAVALGPHELKNISQKIEIYKIVMEVMGGSRFVAPPAPVEEKIPAARNVPVAWILVGILLGALAAVAWFSFRPGQAVPQARAGIHPFYVPNQPGGRYDPGGSPGNQIDRAANGTLTFHYDTGTAGSGVTIYPNRGPFVGDKYVDAGTCDMVRFLVWAPSGLQFQFSVNEAGVGAPGSPSYPGVNGSDGEQYRSPTQSGTGGWRMYDLKLSDFSPSTVWGNQSGNKVLDLKGIESVEMDLIGNQGTGDIRIRNILFSLYSKRGEVHPVSRGEGQRYIPARSR